MSILTERLDLLVHTIDEWGYPISEYLNPPLTREEIDADTEHLPFQVPDEIYDLYQWHNGVDDPGIRFILFGDEQFLSLDEALDEYESIVESYGIHYDDFLLTCFPFSGSQFSSSWSLLPSGSQPLKSDYLPLNLQNLIHDLERPVLRLDEGLGVTNISFLSMLDTEIACFREGAYTFISRSRRVPKVDDSLRRQIWARFNSASL